MDNRIGWKFRALWIVGRRCDSFCRLRTRRRERSWMQSGKVLIVEDQSNFRKGLVKMIESGGLGWDVVGEASNGKDALELLDQVKPDLVLTDIRMPIMDGIEFVGHLRRSYPDMLVIILTGYKN